MTHPNRDPREVLVRRIEIEVSTVCSKALPIVVEGEDLLVRQGNAPNTLPPAIIAVRIFVNVVSEVYNVVDRILQELLVTAVIIQRYHAGPKLKGAKTREVCVVRSRNGPQA